MLRRAIRRSSRSPGPLGARRNRSRWSRRPSFRWRGGRTATFSGSCNGTLRASSTIRSRRRRSTRSASSRRCARGGSGRSRCCSIAPMRAGCSPRRQREGITSCCSRSGATTRRCSRGPGRRSGIHRAARCRRRVDRATAQPAQDPPTVPAELPRDRVNILLVIAWPYEADVQFRSIARPLVELTEKQGLPARVHVLRPPTLDRLREHLRERPNHYHVVHFDGHGSYGPREAPTGPHTYGAPEGQLIFEDDHGKQAPVTAEVLSNLLQEHHVPAMVLNACQSAMLDEQAGHRFASVATALLNAGTRSVVAMSYALYVSGAEQFLPAFYRRLFETGTSRRGRPRRAPADVRRAGARLRAGPLRPRGLARARRLPAGYRSPDLRCSGPAAGIRAGAPPRGGARR
ncbi:CHAT domain-containing protein [Sorangium sp. So ce302]|uniref:CHAT domain-containing protein n=1 Tax=Sorangium sp. So ce302 TaxID=3133297 RepID=UPI003F5D9B96